MVTLNPLRCAWCAFSVLVLALVGAAAAQDSEYPYVAAVSADDVNVRAGAHHRYYSFGRLREGDLVQVVGAKSGWARVVTTGPAFKSFFGFVRFPAADEGPLESSPEGRSAVTTVPTDVFAPNLDARYLPRSSWKPLITLEPGQTLPVLESFESGSERVVKVALPPDAQGWIELAHLRRATPTERVAFEAAVDHPGGTASPSTGDAQTVQAPVAAASGAAVSDGPGPEAPSSTVQPSSAVAATGTAASPMSGTPAPGEVPHVGSPPAPADLATAGAATSAASPLRMAQVVPPVAVSKLRELDAAYARLLEQSEGPSDIEPLRAQYLELAQRYEEHRAITEYARNRAAQLELWNEGRLQRSELGTLLGEAHRTATDADQAGWALEKHGRFVAIGRLDASKIYDGTRLPRLLRVRERESGRTIAYLEPDERLGYGPLLGEIVGVVGDMSYDGRLRVNIIKAQRIEPIGAAVPQAPGSAGAAAIRTPVEPAQRSFAQPQPAAPSEPAEAPASATAAPPGKED
jgi:hypothetical protein